MERITERMLECLCDRLNSLTGSPAHSYVAGKAQVGNFHISHAYGGVSLHRMHNESGGVSRPLYCGHVPKRELYDSMFAFILGIEFAQGQYVRMLKNIRTTIDESQPTDVPGAVMAIDSMIGGVQ